MHIEKFKASGIGGVLAHILRKLTKEQLPRNFSNENVDVSKSHLNYRLDGNTSPFENYKSILSRDDVKVSKRKDLNTFCSVCLTLPEDVKPKDEKAFFQFAYEFLQKRYAPYGNVIIAEVHKDEVASEEHPGRPHLHFVFVPLAVDKKKGFKVSAKEIITMKDLTTLHKDCSDYVEKSLGYRVGILNDEALKEDIQGEKDSIEVLKKILNSKMLKKLPIDEYKKAKDLINAVIEVLNKQKQEIQTNKNDLKNIIEEYDKLVDEYNALDDEIIALMKRKNELKEYLAHCHLVANEVLGDDDFER